jgi:metal-responsive CopG/Arc/MetJ family transcriptional regulator
MKRRTTSYDFSHGRRGAVVPVPPGKTRITIRIDTDILDWFRKQVDAAGGGNYQTLMNQALRMYIEQRENRLEEILRRVIREELRRRRRGSAP